MMDENYDDDCLDDGYFDLFEDRQNDSPFWMNFWNHDIPFGLAILEILRKIIWLPSIDKQLPLVAAYICCNSRAAKNAGYLFHYGRSESGKSQAIKFVSGIFKIPPLLANSTGVACRNHLQAAKYYLDSTGSPILSNRGVPKEKDHCFLLIDNISEANLVSGEYLYQILLGGYDRSTSQISIGGKNGKNIEFNSFGFKIISSIEALHIAPGLTEIHGRLLPIFHEKPPEGWKQEINPDDINWSGLDKLYLSMWGRENSKKYRPILRDLQLHKANWIEKGLSPRKWQICLEIMGSGILAGIWNSSEEAVAFFEEYFNLLEEKQENSDSSFSLLLQQIIDDSAGFKIDAYLSQGRQDEAKKVKIPAKQLREVINLAQSNGELDITPTNERIASAMFKLGWKLTPGGWIQI